MAFTSNIPRLDRQHILPSLPWSTFPTCSPSLLQSVDGGLEPSSHLLEIFLRLRGLIFGAVGCILFDVFLFVGCVTSLFCLPEKGLSEAVVALHGCEGTKELSKPPDWAHGFPFPFPFPFFVSLLLLHLQIELECNHIVSLALSFPFREGLRRRPHLLESVLSDTSFPRRHHVGGGLAERGLAVYSKIMVAVLPVVYGDFDIELVDFDAFAEAMLYDGADRCAATGDV
jgi:hypothetical protein